MFYRNEIFIPDKLPRKSAKHVAFHLQFNKVIGETEVTLENSEYLYAKYLNLKKIEKIYE